MAQAFLDVFFVTNIWIHFVGKKRCKPVILSLQTTDLFFLTGQPLQIYALQKIMYIMYIYYFYFWNFMYNFLIIPLCVLRCFHSILLPFPKRMVWKFPHNLSFSANNKSYYINNTLLIIIIIMNTYYIFGNIVGIYSTKEAVTFKSS